MCHMQSTMHIARRCTALLLPRALPLGQTDRHSAVLIRLSICGLRNNTHDTCLTAFFSGLPK